MKLEGKRILLLISGLGQGQCLDVTTPDALLSQDSLSTSREIQSLGSEIHYLREAYQGAPLNVHAAPKFLGHLGLEFQKCQKGFKFETQPQIED